MISRLLVFILIMIAALSCTNSHSSDNQIRYSDLPAIEYNLITEIEESDRYIPGQLHSLFLSSDDKILVFDRGSTTIEQFSHKGDHVATIATAGGGPGELPQFFTMVDGANDTLMVETVGGRRDLFYPDENGIYRYARNLVNETEHKDQFKWHGIRSNTEVYATRQRMNNNLEELMTNPQDYSSTYINIIKRDHSIVQDSLTLLNTPNPHIMESNGGIFMHFIPFKNTDRFKPFPDGSYMVAKPGEHSLIFYDIHHNETNRITLNVEPREVTKEDIDRALRNTQPEMRRAIEPRIDNLKPPFLDVWATENHIWLLTEKTTKNGTEVVISDREGAYLGKLFLSEFDEIQTVSENHIYTIHRNPEVGNSIRIYEADI